MPSTDNRNLRTFWIVLSVLLLLVLSTVIYALIAKNGFPSFGTPQAPVCNAPYMQFGTGCCLDTNSNSICDGDEQSSLSAPKKKTATELYSEILPSILYVSVTCNYEYTYPDFKIVHSYDEYDGILIDLESLSGRRTEYDSAEFGGTAFLYGDSVLTNNHVVDCDAKEMEAYFKEYMGEAMQLYNTYSLNGSALGEVTYLDISAKAEEIHRQYRYKPYNTVTVTDVEDFLGYLVAEHLYDTVRVRETGKKIELYSPLDGFTKGYSAKVGQHGESFPGNDFAYLETSYKGQDIERERTSNLVPGEDVYVIGFPATSIAYDEDGYSPIEDPDITRGILGSVKRSNEGVGYYALDAASLEGSSGSPVLDQDGNLIGLLTANLEGFSYLLPLTEIRRNE